MPRWEEGGGEREAASSRIACVKAPSLLILAAALAAAWPCAAIVVRPDRDDAEYVELASRYTSALALGGFGEGVLIAPRWILTSAAVGGALRDARASRLPLPDRDHAVGAIYVSPESIHADLALILLAEPVDGIEPTPPHRERDEQGKAVVIAGHGATGTIGGARTMHDGRARAGINTVDRTSDARLVLEVKKPEDASDLQGAAAAGDEGAPAYIEAKGRLSVAGIAQGPRGAGIPKPGDEDIYTRVSAFTPWIDETMFRAAAEEAEKATAKPRRR
jgi:hypothetical protein